MSGDDGARVAPNASAEIRDRTVVKPSRFSLGRLRESEAAPYGVAPAAVLVAVNLVDKVETSVVNGALPLLQAEWGFSDTLAGSIPTAAAVAGLLVTLPGGYLADRVRRVRVLAIVVAGWSVITAASALSRSFGTFYATRVVLGAADNLDNPSASSLLADYYGPRARARTFGFQRIAAGIGIGIGAFIGGAVGEVWGWRAAFLVLALPSLVVAGLCALLPEPLRGTMDRYTVARAGGASWSEARKHLEVPESATSATPAGLRAFLSSVRSVFGIPTIRLLYPGFAIVMAAFAGIGFWLPSFLHRVNDLGEGRAGGLTALIVVVGSLGGAVVGGVLGDRWLGRGRGVRVWLAGTGLIGGSLGLVVATLLDVLVLQVAGLLVTMFLLGVALPNFAATLADVLPAGRRGAGFSVMQLLGAIATSGGPLLIGALSDATGSLRVGFLAMAPVGLAGGLLVYAARGRVDRDIAQVLDAADSP